MSTFKNKTELKQLQLGTCDIVIGDPTVADGAGMLPIEAIPSCTVEITPSMQMGQITGGHQLARATYSRGVRAGVSATLYDVQNTVLGTLLDDAEQPTEMYSVTAVTADSVAVDDPNADLANEIEPGNVFNIDGSDSNDGTYTVISVTDDGTGTTTITVEETLAAGDTQMGDLIQFVDGLLFRTETRKLVPATLCVIPRNLRENAIEKPCWWFPRVVVTEFGGLPFNDNEGEGANEEIDVTFKPLQAETDQSGVLLPEGAKKVFKLAPGRVPGADLAWSLPSEYSAA